MANGLKHFIIGWFFLLLFTGLNSGDRLILQGVIN